VIVPSQKPPIWATARQGLTPPTHETLFKYTNNTTVEENSMNGILSEINIYDETGILKRGYYINGQVADYVKINGELIKQEQFLTQDKLETIRKQLSDAHKEH